MSNGFNGQINISRDLRQNKQVVLGKYDLTDIIFFAIAVVTALILAYTIGFSTIKIVDEFLAIIISVIPMLIILSFGFRKVAGIRKFNYLRMKNIDKKLNVRSLYNNDINSIGDKFIVAFEIDKDKVEYYRNKLLFISNLKRLQIRYEREKVILILDLRYKKDDSIFLDIYNKYFNINEYKRITVEDLYILETIKDYKCNSKKNESKLNDKIRHKTLQNINDTKKANNISLPKESYISIKYEKYINVKDNVLRQVLISLRLILLNVEYAIYYLRKDINLKIKQYNKRNKKYINIDNITNEIDINITDNYKVYSQKLYKKDIYDDFLKEIKNYVDVISYFKKDNDNIIYVDTYFIVKDEERTLKIVDETLNKFEVVVDKLTRNQQIGIRAVSYLMTNEINNYRLYK